MAAEGEAAYQPKDAVGIAIQSTLITGGAGLTVSAIQNTLTKRNVTGWGVFTRTGGIIAMFGTSLLNNRATGIVSSDRKDSCCGRSLWILKSCSRKFA